ncbi:hypothetical protein ACFL3S_13170 [Gemmatimonadota bacterium]
MRRRNRRSHPEILGTGHSRGVPESEPEIDTGGRMGSLTKLVLVASPFLLLILLLVLDWWFRGR